VCLARRLGCRDGAAWFGALGFALGAPLLGRLQSGQFQVFCALCWLPAVFAAGRAVLDEPGRRATVRLAVTLALLFLAGSPWVFWIGAWGAGGWLAVTLVARWLAARDKRAGPTGIAATVPGLCAAALLGAMLVSVQALPFLELVGQGNRSGLTADYSLQHPLEAASWWSLVQSRPGPKFFYWEYNLHSGVLLAALAVLALRFWRQPEIRPLLLLALGFGLLALGPAGAVLPWLVAHAPGWGDFRYPSRYAIVSVLAVALLAALAVEHLLRRVEARRPAWSRWTGLAAAGLLAVNVLDNARALAERATAYANPPVDLREDALVAALRDRHRLDANQPPPRVLAPPWLVREDSGLHARYSTVSSFANPALARVWESLHADLGARVDGFDPVNLPLAAYAAVPAVFRGVNLAARWDAGRGEFEYFSAGVDPRVFLVTAARAVSDWREAAQAMASGADFHAVALVEGRWAGLPATAPATPGASAAIITFFPENVTVECTALAPSLLVLAEPWFPGWSARVDGQDAAVRPINAWMRAVAVPAGAHRVEFAYRSRWLPAGAALTLVAVAVAAWLWFRR
jgi:hypothetical protein